MDIALDLGTGNTRICVQGDGKVIDQPSVISYDKTTNEILTFGEEAFQMLGRTSNKIDVVFPLESSVIAQSGLVEELVNIFLGEVCQSKVIMPRVLACIPGEITEVEKRAIVNAISSFGVRRVLLLESAKAAAFGSDKDIMSPHGTMVVDMGAGSVDIAVLTLGGVSVGKTIKCAGNAMDNEIIKYARRRHNLIIGKAMAKSCKEAIGTVMYEDEEKTFRLKGRDAVRGLPKWVDVTSSEIMDVIFDIAKDIAIAIADVLEDTPPELLSDIHTDGITISGGLSKLSGMKDLIENATNIKVDVATDPSDCVVRGLYKAIDYIDEAEAQKNSLNPLMMVY
ncbi:MAG: rod shape-determining protein [Ruminococcaceae bacterium]|nr:rod shape-determining protein [Oscillospiraceae bacterium]